MGIITHILLLPFFKDSIFRYATSSGGPQSHILLFRGLRPSILHSHLTLKGQVNGQKDLCQGPELSELTCRDNDALSGSGEEGPPLLSWCSWSGARTRGQRDSHGKQRMDQVISDRPLCHCDKFCGLLTS